MINKVTILTLFVLFGCTKLKSDGWIRYSTNYHYVAHPYILELNNKIEAKFFVNKSWYYETDSNGWSKIIGMSDALANHKNSIQLVFKCLNGDSLIAGYYIYKNDITPQENTKQKGPICELIPGERYSVTITRNDDYYFIYLVGAGKWHKKTLEAGEDGIGYIMFPHIGGNYTIKGFYIDLKIEL